MKVKFKAKHEETYKEEHELFILQVLQGGGGVNSIEYVGYVPYNVKIVKFSDYLELYGYTRIGNQFLGYGGKISYSKALVDFLYYARDTYSNERYKIDLDVENVSDIQNKHDLDACIKLLYD